MSDGSRPTFGNVSGTRSDAQASKRFQSVGGHGGRPRLLGRADERQRVRRQLEHYCGRGTGGMMEMLEALRGSAQGWRNRDAINKAA